MRGQFADEVRRVAFQRSINERPCTHAGTVGHVSPQGGTCAPCDAHGIKPVKLRICLTCGTIGCCDKLP